MNLVIFKSNRIVFLTITLCVLFSSISRANKLHDLLNDSERLRNMSSSTFTDWLDRHSSVSIDEVDEELGTPFQLATLAKRLDLMVALKDRGAEIDAPNAQGETALYLAIKNLGATNPEIAITLINLKSNLALQCHGQSYSELAQDLELAPLVEALNRGPMPPIDKSIKAPVIPNDQIKFGDDELSWEASSDEEEREHLCFYDSDEDRVVSKEEINQDEVDDAFGVWGAELDEGTNNEEENQLKTT